MKTAPSPQEGAESAPRTSSGDLAALKPDGTPKRCPNCGENVPRKKRGQARIYCGSKCRDAFHKRMRDRGRAMAPFVLCWRAGRGSKGNAKSAFQELCRIADAYNAEDREAGRPPMSDYIASLGSIGAHMDLKRDRDA